MGVHQHRDRRQLDSQGTDLPGSMSVLQIKKMHIRHDIRNMWKSNFPIDSLSIKMKGMIRHIGGAMAFAIGPFKELLYTVVGLHYLRSTLFK